jgi:hypothetical protein
MSSTCKRMTRQEIREVWDHFAGAERIGHDDPQHTVEAIDSPSGVGRLVEVAENATRALEKHGARVGRRDPSRGPQ